MSVALDIVYASEEFNPEDFYADEEMVITISRFGYIKRTALVEFRAQGRGGIGSKGAIHEMMTSSNIFIRRPCTIPCCSSRRKESAIG